MRRLCRLIRRSPMRAHAALRDVNPFSEGELDAEPFFRDSWGKLGAGSGAATASARSRGRANGNGRGFSISLAAGVVVGWATLSTGVAEAVAPPAALELRDEEGATWSVVRQGGAVRAVFGIPETDASSVSIACDDGPAPPVIEFYAAPMRERGVRASLTLIIGGRAYQLPAQANDHRRFEARLDQS